MQNWKIKRMSYERINKHLEAIERLLYHYLGKVKLEKMEDCPLCFLDCEACLWTIIEGQCCSDLVNELYPDMIVEDVRDDLRNKRWRLLRLDQLPRWKKILQAEKDSRADQGA